MFLTADMAAGSLGYVVSLPAHLLLLILNREVSSKPVHPGPWRGFDYL